MTDERGAVGGTRTGKGNRGTRSKPEAGPFCPSHDLTWIGTRAAAVRNLRISVLGMARPYS
jgi:hypothetical protein